MPSKAKATTADQSAGDVSSTTATTAPKALFASAGIIGVDASGSAPDLDGLGNDGNGGGLEVRRTGDDTYVTRQQTVAASGADGIDQYELAKAQVNKVAKSVLATDDVLNNVQLRKEVLLGLIKSSTVFINYLAAAALDKTHEAGNKTMSAQHVLAAFKELDFPPHYYAQLKKEYNEKLKAEQDKTSSKAAAAAAAAAAKEAKAVSGPTEGQDAMEVDDEEDAADADDDDASANIGQESIAVGEETLAAGDPIEEEDNEDEEEEEEAEKTQ